MIIKDYTRHAKKHEQFTRYRLSELNVKVFSEILLPDAAFDENFSGRARVIRKYFLTINTETSMLYIELPHEDIEGNPLNFTQTFSEFTEHYLSQATQLTNSNSVATMDDELVNITMMLFSQAEIYFFTPEIQKIIPFRFTDNEAGLEELTTDWVRNGLQLGFRLPDIMSTGLYTAPDDAESYAEFIVNSATYPSTWMEAMYGANEYLFHNENEVVTSIRNVLRGNDHLVQ